MRRWLLTALGAGLLYAAAAGTLAALDARADPLRLGLLVLLVVAVGGIMLDGTPLTPTAWAAASAEPVRLTRLDPGTAGQLRLLEAHLAARSVDDGLRTRLRELADRALRARHATALGEPRAAELLGPELSEVLERPAYRLAVDDIERCVRRIEEL